MVQLDYVADENSEIPAAERQTSWLYLLFDFLSDSEQIAGIVVLMIIIVFGAIRVKKAGISVTSKTPTVSAPSIEATGTPVLDSGISQLLIKDAQRVLHESWFNSFKQFWTNIPVRIWNFFINAFLISRYRKEWGKYQSWYYRAPPRPKKIIPRKSHIGPHILLQEKRKESSSPTSEAEAKPLPKPIPHNHSGCRRIRINVGGCIYETQTRTLNRFPHTLLGDPNKRLRYFDPIKQEYFFDRNRESFESILYYYQSGGRMKRSDDVAADILLDDIKFFGLPQSVIYQYLLDEGLSGVSEPEDILPANLLMRKLWLLFDFPQSSMQAQIVSLISILAIVLSITTFCIETMDLFASRYRYFLDTRTGIAYGFRDGSILDIHDPFFFTETVCSVWFIVEYLARLASSPVKFKFLTNTLNLIDLIAVMPYIVQVATPTSSEVTDRSQGQAVFRNNRPASSVSVIRVVRLIRVFRIFKLSRHSRGLKILGKTLRASLNELMLLIFFVGIGVVLFSSTMFFAEIGTPGSPFTSIPDGFWWAMITITTIGYGDNVPKSVWGKVVGALCAIAGVLTLALPVPVIVSNFNFFYHQAIGEADLSWIKISHAPPCPFRPIDPSTDDPFQTLDDFNTSKRRQHGGGDEPSIISESTNIYENSSDEEFGMLKFKNKPPRPTPPPPVKLSPRRDTMFDYIVPK